MSSQNLSEESQNVLEAIEALEAIESDIKINNDENNNLAVENATPSDDDSDKNIADNGLGEPILVDNHEEGQEEEEEEEEQEEQEDEEEEQEQEQQDQEGEGEGEDEDMDNSIASTANNNLTEITTNTNSSKTLIRTHENGPISDSLDTTKSNTKREPKFLGNSTAATFTVKSKNLLTNSSFQSNQPFEQQFANIFDDEEMAEVDFTGEDDVQHSVGYFCIFCPETFKDRDEARRHYQKHVNYYSMMCSLCGEGATDMQEFLRHHTESHPEAKKGRYKRREQPIIDKWINGFLYAQSTITRAFPPRDHCPVCEKIFTKSQIESNRPKKSSFSRKIDHIHRHLCYLPYECIRCKEEGKEYTVAYFESKASNHIKLKHPEIDDTDSRWLIFQKTISIAKLDDFISNYLAKFGISMEYERRPVKKLMRELVSASNGANGVATSSRNNNNALPSSSSSSSDLTPPINNHASTTDNGVIVLDDDDDADQSQAGDSSAGSEEPVDGNSMIVAVSPSHAEYIESGRTQKHRRNSQEYYCLFCNAKFSCKLDAYPHYGEHLEYKPVLCLLCDNKFHDTDAFTLHHQLDHPEATDLKYEIREDQNIERWVDEFLESQTTPLSSRLTLNCSCATCCPVCERLLPRRSLVASASTPCTSHNDVYFAEHVHQHLAYNAYECTFCKKLGHSTRIPNLDSAALNHVRENHYVRDANLYQLSRAFPKTLTIAKIERFIAESVQKRRLLEKKWRIFKFEQIKMERLKLQQQMHAARLYQQQQSLQYSQTNGFGSLNRDNSNLHFRNNHLSIPSKNNVNHVRVEGGRVVNLPSPLSIKAIQQRNNLKSSLSSNPNKNNFNNVHNSSSANHGSSSSSSANVVNLSTKTNNAKNNSNNDNGNSTNSSLNHHHSIINQHNYANNSTANSLMMSMMMNLNNFNDMANMSPNFMKSNTIDLTNDSSANDEGMLSSGISTGVRFYVKCLHCNIELPNRKQLKVHHRQAHPGLTMACFTTPKPIIASEVSP